MKSKQEIQLERIGEIFSEEFARNEGKRWQDKKDKEHDNALNQTIVNMQKRIASNFPTPNPEGGVNPDPNSKMSTGVKAGAISVALLELFKSCNNSQNQSSTNGTTPMPFWEALFKSSNEEDNNTKKQKNEQKK